MCIDEGSPSVYLQRLFHSGDSGKVSVVMEKEKIVFYGCLSNNKVYGTADGEAV